MTTAAVVLAAGQGSRYAGPTHKLLAAFDGKAVIEWAVEHALAAGLDETIVVVGAEAGVLDLLPAGVTAVESPRAIEGIVLSLQAGREVAEHAGHDAIVVGLGDQPLVPPAAWRAVARHTDHPIVVATYGGVRGNPVRLARSVWSRLPTMGDEGARAVMRGRPQLVGEVPCLGQPGDIDTVEDLDRWTP